MPNIKPAALRTGKTGKAEKSKREEKEIELKGTKPISNVAPKELSTNGKKVYKEIIGLLPSDFLNGGDTFVVGIVAEALDRMQYCQAKLNNEGLFTQLEEENNAVKMYERYSKIFDKFSSKLGLSPKDRAALAVLNIKDSEEKESPLAKAMRGESNAD